MCVGRHLFVLFHIFPPDLLLLCLSIYRLFFPPFLPLLFPPIHVFSDSKSFSFPREVNYSLLGGYLLHHGVINKGGRNSSYISDLRIENFGLIYQQSLNSVLFSLGWLSVTRCHSVIWFVILHRWRFWPGDE